MLFLASSLTLLMIYTFLASPSLLDPVVNWNRRVVAREVIARLNSTLSDSLPSSFFVKHTANCEYERIIIKEVKKSIFSTREISWQMHLSKIDSPIKAANEYCIYVTPWSSDTTKLWIWPMHTSDIAILMDTAPQTRSGAQGTPMLLPDWFARLRQVQPHHVFIDTSKDLQPQDIIQGELELKLLEPESVLLEYKHPSDLVINENSLIKDFLLKYLTQNALNASGDKPGTYTLRIGVEDRSLLPIGFIYQYDPIEPHIRLNTELRKHFEGIFPPVCPTWIKFKIDSVQSTSSSDWMSDDLGGVSTCLYLLELEATGSNKSANKKLCKKIIHDILILAKGWASCIHTEGHRAVLMPSFAHDELKTSVASFADMKNYRLAALLLNMVFKSNDHSIDTSDTEIKKQLNSQLNHEDIQSISTSNVSLFLKSSTSMFDRRRRSVVTVELNVPIETPRAFFGCGPLPEAPEDEDDELSSDSQSRDNGKSTNGDVKYTIDAPVLMKPGAPCQRLDAFIIWLRSRVKEPLTVGVSSRLISKLFLKVLIIEPTNGVLRAEVEAFVSLLLGQPFVFDLVLKIDDKAPKQLQTKNSVIFAFVTTIREQLFQSLVQNLDTSIFLLVPSSMPRPWAVLNKSPLVLNPSPRTQIIEARMFVKLTTDLVAPLPQSPSQFDDSVAINLPTRQIVFDYVSMAIQDPETIKRSAERWLKREDRSAPPWETIDNGIVVTRQAHDLSLKIARSWPETGKPMRLIKLQSPAAGSGATALARCVGYLQHKIHTRILWIQETARVTDEMKLESEWIEEFSRCPSSGRFLVIADTHIDWNPRIQASLNQAVATNRVSVLVLVIEESTNNYKKSNFTPSSYIINPFLDIDDIQNMFNSLSRFASDDGKSALMTVRKAALANNPMSYSRHIFIFALAAFHGVHMPAEDWIKSLYEEIQLQEVLKKAAVLIAFVSSFSPSGLQSLPGDFCDRLFKRTSFREKSKWAFYELFEHVQDDSIACVHPFLARLFLSRAFKLSWSEQFLPIEPLLNCWKDVRVILKEDFLPSEQASILGPLLSERPRGADFSMLVSQLAMRTAYTPDLLRITQEIIDPSTQKILGGHYHLLWSRIYRARYQITEENRGQNINLALNSAEQAVDCMPISDEWHWPAKQNLAVQLGTAAHYQTNPKKTENQNKAHLIFKELFENSTLDKRDIVSQAYKKCGLQNQAFWATKEEFLGPKAAENNEQVQVPVITWWKHYDTEVSGIALGCQVPGLN